MLSLEPYADSWIGISEVTTLKHVQCDRCKIRKVLPDSGSESERSDPFVDWGKFLRASVSRQGWALDLCPECLASFERWVEDGIFLKLPSKETEIQRIEREIDELLIRRRTYLEKIFAYLRGRWPR